MDEAVAKKLWEDSDKLVEKVEKEQAKIRARLKAESAKREEEAKEREKVQEIQALVDTIKKGKEKDAAKAKGKRSKKAKVES